MGLQGRKWNDCQGEEKDRLRQRFDQIKASVQNPHSGIEHILNKIGVVENDRSRQTKRTPPTVTPFV